MNEFVIFGAKSIALGIYTALKSLYTDKEIIGFIVSDKSENPDTLAGIPVYELKSFENKEICVLIAVPENIHFEIIKILEENGFFNYICIDSEKEAKLMEKYYAKIGTFKSVHSLNGGDIVVGS